MPRQARHMGKEMDDWASSGLERIFGVDEV